MNVLERLNEGLEAKYFGDIIDEAIYGGSKWSNLSDEERQECLDADPTYSGKEDSAGKYSEWIFRVYSDFEKNHPSEKFRFSHCKDALTQFMRSKNNLKDESMKDINKFKSLDELDNFLNNSQNFANTFIEIPEESSIKDAKKIFENSRCEIWVPLTHEASVALAGEPKTKWCTAFSNPYNYNSYTKEGPLFILIMKDNSGEMYQFHFERDTAMDKYDDPVEWEDFPEMRSREVKNFRRGLFEDIDKGICKQLDSLLDKETHLPKSGADIDKTGELIKSIHDEDLALTYSGPFDEWCLEQFYVNLTPILTKDSPSIKYLKRCMGRVNIALSSIVTDIRDGCFRDCNSLESIVIPNSVTNLGKECFRLCKSLKSITIPSSVKSIGGWCFSHCKSLTSITIPNSVTSMGKGCFFNCKSLKSIAIPDEVTSIGDNCFEYCESLESVTMPGSVKSIGGWCFRDCTSLTNITIPNSVMSMGEGCFINCKSLKSITIPSSVTGLGRDCFCNCTSLKSITIPNDVTGLGWDCFSSCKSLTSVTIPNSVTSIGGGCFYGCSHLKDVYYSGSQGDRQKIYIDADNGNLLKAKWHYNWKE